MFRQILVLATGICICCSQLFAESRSNATFKKGAFSPQAAVRNKGNFPGLNDVNAILRPPAYHSGFFSSLLTVMGFLQECDQASWDGYCVDFAEEGSFYEPSMGKNWWTYYFEPICKVPDSKYDDRFIAEEQKMQYGLNTTFQDRTEINGIIQKYIHVNGAIQAIVDEEAELLFGNAPVIGVNYVRPDRVFSRANNSFFHFFNGVNKLLLEDDFADAKIFVSTDDSEFLQQMIERYGSKVVYREVPRYVNNVKPAYETLHPNFDRGLDELIECLLLAECQAIVRTNSHMSVVASLFNPTLQFITVRQLRSN